MKTELIYKLIEMLISSPEKEEAIISYLQEQYPIGKKILLRGADSGVIYGTLVSVRSGVFQMKDSRRLWYWKCKKGFTLEDIANYGLHEDSKLTSVVPLCDVTDNRVALLLPCSKEAIKSIESLSEYQPK